jgi:hypothetical protein
LGEGARCTRVSCRSVVGVLSEGGAYRFLVRACARHPSLLWRAGELGGCAPMCTGLTLASVGLPVRQLRVLSRLTANAERYGAPRSLGVAGDAPRCSSKSLALTRSCCVPAARPPCCFLGEVRCRRRAFSRARCKRGRAFHVEHCATAFVCWQGSSRRRATPVSPRSRGGAPAVRTRMCAALTRTPAFWCVVCCESLISKVERPGERGCA